MQFKIYLSEISGLSQDALHIYLALGMQLAAALALRRPISHPLPWLCVLAVLVANEAADLFAERGRLREWQVLGGLRDLWNTMALPTMLLLLARYAPSLMSRPVYSGAPTRRGPLATTLEDAENR